MAKQTKQQLTVVPSPAPEPVKENISDETVRKLAEEKGWRYYHHALPSQRKWKHLASGKQVSSMEELKKELSS